MNLSHVKHGLGHQGPGLSWAWVPTLLHQYRYDKKSTRPRQAQLEILQAHLAHVQATPMHNH